MNVNISQAPRPPSAHGMSPSTVGMNPGMPVRQVNPMMMQNQPSSMNMASSGYNASAELMAMLTRSGKCEAFCFYHSNSKYIYSYLLYITYLWQEEQW